MPSEKCFFFFLIDFIQFCSASEMYLKIYDMNWMKVSLIFWSSLIITACFLWSLCTFLTSLEFRHSFYHHIFKIVHNLFIGWMPSLLPWIYLEACLKEQFLDSFFLQCISTICQANFSTAEFICTQLMYSYIWVVLCYLLVWT